jgi:aquaporin Z
MRGQALAARRHAAAAESRTRPVPEPSSTAVRVPTPQPAHSGWHWRIWFAEGAGTALLVLGALSAICLDFGSGSPVADVFPSESLRRLMTGLLVGSTVGLVAISPLGRLSGAHLNPAVTLSFRVLGRISGHDAAGYLLAQLLGAVAGAVALRLLWGSIALSVEGGVTEPTVAVTVAAGLEAAMTALLMATIFFFVSRMRLARWTPVAVLPLIAILIWLFAPLTATSLNPARSAGPALVFTNLADLWLYVVAPTAGALTVAILWKRRHPSTHPKTAKLFHDPRYPCSMACELPAMSHDSSLPRGSAPAVAGVARGAADRNRRESAR